MDRIKVVAPKDRPVRIRTTTGAVFHLKPGEERMLPPYAAPIAAASGCMIVPVGFEGSTPEVSGLSKEERHRELVAAVTTLVNRGKPEDFTESGRPRKPVVAEMVDFDPTVAEINEAAEAVLSAESQPQPAV